MMGKPIVNCGYRQLQSSGAPQNLTSRKTDRQHYDGYGRIWAFMVCSVQSMARNVIIMAPLIPLMVSFQLSGSEFWLTKVLGGEKVFVYRGEIGSRSWSSWRWRFKTKSPCCRA